MKTEELLNIRKAIIHADCHDGVASAMIIHDVLPDVEIRMMTHNTTEYNELPAEPGILFCDIVPPPNRVQEFVDAGAIVLDHHKGVQNIVEKFGEHGKFADEKKDPGISGAMLAYKHVWLPLQERAKTATTISGRYELANFARLIGIRDTWQNKEPDWETSRAIGEVLTFFPLEHWIKEHEVYVLPDELKIGQALVKRRDFSITRLVKNAFRFSLGGINYVAFQGSKSYVSDASAIFVKEGVDVIMGFSFFSEPTDTPLDEEEKRQADEHNMRLTGSTLEVPPQLPKMPVSVRTSEKVDAAAFARLFGGNGHSRAAGFAIPIDPELPNPYALVIELASYAAQNGFREITKTGMDLENDRSN